MESPARTAAHVPGEQELYSSWALFILVSLLAGALWTSYFLQLRRITAVHETVVSILAGENCRGFSRPTPEGGFGRGSIVLSQACGSGRLDAAALLTVANSSGPQVHFFRNFGSILLFAFIGTVTSTVVIGILIWIVALTGVEGVSLSFLDSLIFGSVLSSTDPVTVLAIFSQLKVEPKLYAMIFGESMLNDAVAIVLFGTFERFRGEELHLHNVFLGVWYFFGVFFGSLIIGVVTGALVALMLKHSQLSKLPAIESCLVALTAYSTYLFSNGCQMSGKSYAERS
ncbi:MAG: Sodium/hydrogen exchanger family-domain-containing protein [Olpidium bornovanus]|uniref:Sodium/hydrogen exchanger family-domain-containing protein n=1 Tax=Olpidium bornovanus TaxID=278681 RepID=A0A8H7ZJZ1_9FUNG|nr:MAG: Sodium/hydrogen exchanger family-domain-containing protein [Olpidium bornovanus]